MNDLRTPPHWGSDFYLTYYTVKKKSKPSIWITSCMHNTSTDSGWNVKKCKEICNVISWASKVWWSVSTCLKTRSCENENLSESWQLYGSPKANGKMMWNGNRWYVKKCQTNSRYNPKHIGYGMEHLHSTYTCWPCMLNKKLPFCKAISSSFNDCDEMQRRMRNHTRRKDWSWSVARKAESLVSNKRSWTYKTPQRSHVIPLIHSDPLQKP